MASWAVIAKNGHELREKENRKREEYLKSLNQFGFKKPLKFNRSDNYINKIILLRSKLIDKYSLNNVFDYVGE